MNFVDNKTQCLLLFWSKIHIPIHFRDRHDGMVVEPMQSISITTKVASPTPLR